MQSARDQDVRHRSAPPVTSAPAVALAAIGFAEAKRRRQIMIATSSIGPGALNKVTAAGTAHANRLPVLLIAGDTFTSRLPDPVLQQVEHFNDPTLTVNDALKAVTRYRDRITHPAQIIASLPQAVAAMLDPADCGPAFIALPQDTQELAFDYLKVFFEEHVWAIPLHVDFAAHAAAMGAASRHVESLADLAAAQEWAKGNDRATVISIFIATDACAWVPGDADRDVGVPEVSTRDSVHKARARQRVGV